MRGFRLLELHTSTISSGQLNVRLGGRNLRVDPINPVVDLVPFLC
jgi:hypothetical protein